MKAILRKDGRWMARLWINGKRKSVYGRTEKEAIELALAILETNKTSVTSKYKAGTVAEFVDVTWKARGEGIWRQSTRRKYTSILKHHILPAIGHLKLKDVRYEDIQAMKGRLKRKDKRKGDLSQKQVREIVLLTKDIFSFAVQLRRIEDNPCALVKLPTISRKKRRIEPERDFTKRILEAGKGTFMEGPLFCALFLGLRRGEICGLKWEKIDRDKLRIEVDTSLDPNFGEQSTKGEPRSIPISSGILKRLDNLGDQNSVYVFTDKDKPLKPNEVSKRMSELCEKAGLQRRTFHDLRAFAASNLAALGVDPISILEILGHKTFDTTLIYLDGKETVKRNALTLLLEEYLPSETEEA